MIRVGVDGRKLVRFDSAPLLAMVPGSATTQARRLGVSTRTIHRWRAGMPMPLNVADRCASRLGLHPSNIWDDWQDR